MSALKQQASVLKIITFKLKWSAVTFRVVLNNTSTPYTFYSNLANESDAIVATWTDKAKEYLMSATGHDEIMTNQNNHALVPYGGQFIITFPSTTFDKYTLVGYSRTPRKLGDTSHSEDIFSDDYLNNSGRYVSTVLTLNNDLLQGQSVLNLYPVFALTELNLVLATASNGMFSYSITNDANIIKGFIADTMDNLITGEDDSLEVSLAYYQSITIVANKPINNYDFDSITHNGNAVAGNTLTIAGNVAGGSLIEVKYVPKGITITARIEYTTPLKEGGDLSTIQLGDKTLTASTPLEFEVSADASIPVILSLSEYYILDSITSGTNVIYLLNNAFTASLLSVDSNDNAELVITLKPKTYTIILTLQGGIMAPIVYTSNAFGDGTIDVAGKNEVEVFTDAIITLSAPEKAMCEFAYFTINGERPLVNPDKIENYSVVGNTTIAAYYIQNQYAITYYFHNGRFQTVNFVGGDIITVGNGLGDYSVAGFEHVGWKDSLDISSNEYTYVNGNQFTSEKRNYEFFEVVTGKEIQIEFVFNCDGVETRELIYTETGSNTMNVAYATRFNLPMPTDFTNSQVANKSLYGFTTSLDDGARIYACGSNIDINSNGDIEYVYPTNGNPEKITLYTVYYGGYTYTFTYDKTTILSIICGG